MQTINQFLLQKPTGTLYHYTDAAGLMGILREKELWATSAHHLNDASEFRHALSLLEIEIQARLRDPTIAAETERMWKDYLESWRRDPPLSDSAVVSLSTEGNQLSQWRAYCPQGNGYSLGFSPADLSYGIKRTRALLVQCIYQPAQQEELVHAVADYIERINDRAQRTPGWGRAFGFLHRVMRKVVAVMLALKDKGFEEEKEWRLVVEETGPIRFRTGRFGILPYRAIPLCVQSQKPPFTDVYIGPHQEPVVAQRALLDFLRAETDVGNLYERVRQSAIPYRY